MPIVRPSPALVAARKREIAARYKAQAKRKAGRQPFTFAAVRVAELTKIYEHRYGLQTLPESDDGLEAARIMAHHLGALRSADRRISDWLTRFVPWLDMASRERLIRDATEHPLRWRADKLAWKIKLTIAERDQLKVRTIGAVDMGRAERAARAKQRKLERDQARRRAAGARPRAEYEATSVNRAKPWKAAGMGRTAWYQAGKPR